MKAYTLVITQGDPRVGDQTENEVCCIEGLSYYQAAFAGYLWINVGLWASVYDADGALVFEVQGDDCHD